MKCFAVAAELMYIFARLELKPTLTGKLAAHEVRKNREDLDPHFSQFLCKKIGGRCQALGGCLRTASTVE